MFSAGNICEIDDNYRPIRSVNQTIQDEEGESIKDDEKLIAMLKILPKRKSNPVSTKPTEVTSFVDLSTPGGRCKNRKSKGTYLV